MPIVKVLIIRPRLIGDVVFVTPAIRALARNIPGIHLTVLVEVEAAPVVITNPHVSEVIVARRSRGLIRVQEDLALSRRLRAENFDVVIDFHGGPRSAWLTWISGAQLRIGYGLRGRRWMYTRLVDRPRYQRPRHSVENQWDLLAPLGESFKTPPNPRDDAVEMREDPAAASRVTQRLSAAHISCDHKIIVLHVSAGNPFRRWPVDFFVHLAISLAAADQKRRIFVVSGPSDTSVVTKIVESARSKLGSRAEAIIEEEFDLAELRAVITRAILFIGGDSGPLHVAATTRVPIVGIFGSTLPIRSAPWRDPAHITESVDIGELPCRPCNQRRCEPGDFRCLTQLMPAAVIAVAERAIGYAHDNRHDDYNRDKDEI